MIDKAEVRVDGHRRLTDNRIELWRSLPLLFLFIIHGGLETCALLALDQPEPQHMEPGSSPNISDLYTKTAVLQRAPHFVGTAVFNGEIVKLSLSQFAGKYVVLLFYALDFSTVCPTEIRLLSDRIEEFRKLNAQPIACSVDSPYAHMAWMQLPKNAGGLGPVQIPLLSDLTHKISEDYGVYVPELGHSLRGLFIIDPHGILRQASLNDFSAGRSIDELLRILRAMRHFDATGETCPANWQPNGKTVKGSKNKYHSYPATKNAVCS